MVTVGARVMVGATVGWVAAAVAAAARAAQVAVVTVVAVVGVEKVVAVVAGLGWVAAVGTGSVEVGLEGRVMAEMGMVEMGERERVGVGPEAMGAWVGRAAWVAMAS